MKRIGIEMVVIEGVIFCCILVFLIFVETSLALNDAEGWLSIENEYFIVYYKPGYEADAEETLRYAMIVRNITMEKYPHKLPFKVEIFIHPQAIYSAVTHAVSTRAVIDIRCPSWKGSWGGYEELGDPFRRVLNHEYVHAVYYYDLYSKRSGWKENVNWFAQGIAEYISQNYLPQYIKEVRDAVESGFFISGNPYAFGLFIVEYMYKEYGKDKVISLIRSDAPTFWDAVKQTFGVSPQEFERNWIKWIYGKFNLTIPPHYLEKEELEELCKELQQKYDSLNRKHSKLLEDYQQLNATYHDLLADYISLESRYQDLKSEHETKIAELNTTKSLMYLFAALTVIFISTTIYFSKIA